MRTNIDINDELLKEAMKLSGLKTKKAVVEKALSELVLFQHQASIRNLFGKLEWDDDLEAMRLDK